MKTAATDTDVVIIGCGIVGLATALALTRSQLGLRVTLIDKENRVASHQTGRNSGVIHSGVYYVPGSYKARLCREGRSQLIEFAQRYGVRHELCGKVIVATEPGQLKRLAQLEDRARRNGVEHRRVDPNELGELEPHVAAIAALHVRDAGIIDFTGVCERLVEALDDQGASFSMGHDVQTISEGVDSVTVETDAVSVRGRSLVNCAGLHSDRVAQLAGVSADVRIMPFRGEYFELSPRSEGLVRNLIYPVPDPRFPFLGVHFTRMIDGGIHCGPNAVAALAREGYDWGMVNRADLREILTAASTWKLARTYWRTGLSEIHRSLSKSAFTKALQQLVPAVTESDLVRAPAGVRAQAIDSEGRLLDDFAFADTPRSVHVLNAPSPAATAALAIGGVVAERLTAKLR